MGTFRLREPGQREIDEVLASMQDAPFSYAPVGSPVVPEGWFDNRGGCELGRGAAVFARARDAMTRWEHFDIGWVRAMQQPAAAVTVGAVVAVLSKTFGLWTVNVTRIVSVWDEPRRFAFSYGTLPRHVEAGEETFSVTWRPDDRVTYDVWSYSRARHPLVRLATPLARRLQKRFIVESCARMRRACGAQ